jgi:hypothetical protein
MGRKRIVRACLEGLQLRLRPEPSQTGVSRSAPILEPRISRSLEPKDAGRATKMRLRPLADTFAPESGANGSLFAHFASAPPRGVRPLLVGQPHRAAAGARGAAAGGQRRGRDRDKGAGHHRHRRERESSRIRSRVGHRWWARWGGAPATASVAVGQGGGRRGEAGGRSRPPTQGRK